MEGSVYWVDADVLLRFLTNSPPELAERSAGLLGRARDGEIRLKVHAVVVAETVWVLQSFYEYSRSEIARVLVPLLDGRGLSVERTALRALESMAENNVDFADALIAEAARARDEGVASFDRDFRKLDVGSYEPG